MGSEWNIVKFEELITVLTDYHANGSYMNLKKNVTLLDIPDYAVMIRTTNFEQEDFSNRLKYISEKAYNFMVKSKVYPGDLIMNKIANAGSCYYMPDLKRPVSLAMNLFLIRIDSDKANSRFVFYFLKANEAYVKNFAEGSVTKTITKAAVRNLDIKLPNITIQNSIVNILGSIEDKIELNRQMNQTLEQMAQALFKSWFVDFDPVIDNALAAGNPIPEPLQKRAEQRKTLNENRKPLPKDIQALFPAEFEFSEELDKWVPKGWRVVQLQEIVTKLGDGLHGTPKYNDDGDYHFINGNNLTNGKIVFNKNTKKVDYSQFEKYKKELNDRTILVSINGTIGNVATYNNENIILGKSACYFNVKNDVEKTYVKQIVVSPYFMNYLETTATGTTIKNVSLKSMREFPILFPPLQTQKAIGSQLVDIDDKTLKNLNQIEELTKLRDTLLPKLVSGEVRVPEEILKNQTENYE